MANEQNGHKTTHEAHKIVDEIQGIATRHRLFLKRTYDEKPSPDIKLIKLELSIMVKD